MNMAHALALLVLTLIPVAHAQEAAPEATLRASLGGPFASQLTVSGGPWLATGSEQTLSVIFSVDDLAAIKQFDVVVRLEPPSAFDTSTVRFLTESPFLNPIAGGVDVLSEQELKMGAAIFGTAISGSRLLGTLLIQTTAQFSPQEPARLVIQSFSIGPTSFERDSYEEGELMLEILVSEAPTAVEASTWGAMKATGKGR
jgi:hypothetical protein